MSALVTSRRRLLLSAPAALLPLGACATTGTAPAPPAAARPPFCLPPVKAAAERVIREVVGLRPYRKGGFVVRAEALGDKRLVHNYGHGGAGITLSWGTARLATELGLQGHQGKVAVLGAGVCGLTTARLAQEAGFEVTVYAKHMPPETTSNIAGGQWYPAFLYRRGTATPAFMEQFRQAAGFAYRRHQIHAGHDYGVRWMTNYDISDSPPGPDTFSADDWLQALIPNSRDLAPGQHPFGQTWVSAWDGMIIEPPVFLRRLMQDIQIAGGRILIRDFHSAAEVAALSETLVFNCTGLGARELFGDTELRPLRGQLAVLEPQAEVDYALTAPGGLYMFSRTDGVILGGTHQMDDWNLEPDPDTTRRIVEGHRALFAGVCATS
jgi:glycine/D-amino acid oxidase-like deaminating enzyme